MGNFKMKEMYPEEAAHANACAVPIDEAAEQLRRAVNGEVELTLVGGDWANYWGDRDVIVGDWRFVIFNDCGELDYVDRATAPDGRTSGVDEWAQLNKNWIDPLYSLTDDEREKLEEMLENAGV